MQGYTTDLTIDPNLTVEPDPSMLAIYEAIEAFVSAAKQIPGYSQENYESIARLLTADHQDPLTLEESALTESNSVMSYIEHLKKDREERRKRRESMAFYDIVDRKKLGTSYIDRTGYYNNSTETSPDVHIPQLQHQFGEASLTAFLRDAQYQCNYVERQNAAYVQSYPSLAAYYKRSAIYDDIRRYIIDDILADYPDQDYVINVSQKQGAPELNLPGTTTVDSLLPDQQLADTLQTLYYTSEPLNNYANTQTEKNTEKYTLTKSEIEIVNKIYPKLTKINKYLDDYKRLRQYDGSKLSAQQTLSLKRSENMYNSVASSFTVTEFTGQQRQPDVRRTASKIQESGPLRKKEPSKNARAKQNSFRICEVQLNHDSYLGNYLIGFTDQHEFYIWNTEKYYYLANINLAAPQSARVFQNDYIRPAKYRELGNQIVSSDMCLEISTGQESWTLILNDSQYQKYVSMFYKLLK